MANDDRTTIIPRRTPESAAMSASVKRAMAITARLNRLTFDDADEIRAARRAATFSKPLRVKDTIGPCRAGLPDLVC